MSYPLRKMTFADIKAVTSLLQENSQSQQGGLYGDYPHDKVEAMYQSSTNAIVATDQEQIIAVVFSFPVSSFLFHLLLKKLIDVFLALHTIIGFTVLYVLINHTAENRY